MAHNAGEAMTEDEAIERVIESVDEMLGSLAGVSSTANERAELRGALREFATAIRKQCQAEMACTLLTQESERMGGYENLPCSGVGCRNQSVTSTMAGDRAVRACEAHYPLFQAWVRDAIEVQKLRNG